MIDFIDNVYVPDVLAVADVYNDWFEIGSGCGNVLAYGGFPQDDQGHCSCLAVPISMIKIMILMRV